MRFEEVETAQRETSDDQTGDAACGLWLMAYTSLMAVSMGRECGLSDLSSGLCPAPS